MTTLIMVSPDPARPHGGYARLSVSADAVETETVAVSVYDPFSQRYLGRTGFQGEPAQFGPYPVTRDDGSAWVTIGPEIVNQIEEFAQLRLTVGTAQGEVNWPDNVVPAFGAARNEGIDVLPIDDTPQTEQNLVGKLSAPEQPAPAPEPDPVAPPAPAPLEAKSRTGLFAILGILLIAAAAYFLLFDNEQDTPTPPAEPVETPETVLDTSSEPPAPPPVPCPDQMLNGINDLGFDAARAALLTCADRLTPDAALKVLEQGATAANPDALLLFGLAYDGGATDPDFEDKLGVTFEDNPAQAAEYYYRAREKGDERAITLLQAVCFRLGSAQGTVARSAYQDWCS